MDPNAPRIAVVALLLAIAIGASAATATAGFEEDSPPEDDLGFSEVVVTSLEGPSGPVPKGDTATYTAVVENQGNAAAHPEETVGLFSYRVNGDRPVPNPFRSATQTGPGGCAIERTPSSFGDYHSAICSVGGLEPGQSIEITATIEINESMDLSASGERLTTLVDAPPELSGSNKIKVRGLPDSCAAGDFTLKAKAKGATKIVAALVGPLNAEGKPPAGEYSRNKSLGAAKGSKLKVPIDTDSLDLGYYELKLSAKYDGAPKQKAAAFFQRC